MSSNENWVLQVDSVVYKFLKKIPRKDAERLLFIIEQRLPENPFGGDVQKMSGSKISGENVLAHIESNSKLSKKKE